MHIKKSKLCLSIGATLLSAIFATTQAAPQQSFQKGKTIADDPFLKAVVTSENMEPAIIHPAQSAAAQKKLNAYKQKTGRTPNILIFIVDDMGWGDIGANGGGTTVGAPTPNIDKLAREGLLFTSFYAQPLSTPSRAAMMTGRLPVRTGLVRPILTGEKLKANPWDGEVTAAGLLQKAGYHTGMIGKWHLGEIEGAYPQQNGYDEYFGFLQVVSNLSEMTDERLYPNLIHDPERLEAMRSIQPPEITSGVKGGPLKVEQSIKTIDDISRMDQKFADYSDGFIRRAGKKNEPFYLVHSFSRVHNDNYPAPGYAGKSPAKYPYKDGVVEVDDIVGRLMKTLKDTGQLENTVVFFTSDNGANEDVWPDSGFHPWKGGKGTTWGGGIRVPGIAYWPGMIKAGRVSDGIFDILDLFNTSVALGGQSNQIPKDRYFDGIDQTSFLLADDGESNRETSFFYSGNQFAALRWNEFKVHFRVMETTSPRKNIDSTVMSAANPAPWAYNLYIDPKEQIPSHHGFEWGYPRALNLVRYHMSTFKKYPVKDIGLNVP